jgi:hypothetical protein
MKALSIYVTAQRWSIAFLDALRGHATGVVLGDLFCQKRMFEDEWFDIFDLARHARSVGFEVVFQTPAYNTPRSLEPTMALIRKLARENLIDAALVHDIGVVQAMEEYSGVSLWWDRFSFNRDFIPNAPLITFLRNQRISRIEVTRPAHVGDVAEGGCGVLLYCYGPEIASFGRICYTEYFLNEPCERKILCARSRPFIASVDKVPLQYLADGYTLLDKDDPMVRLSPLEPALVNRIDGMTAYLRGPEEIAALRKGLDNLWKIEKLQFMPGQEIR